MRRYVLEAIVWIIGYTDSSTIGEVYDTRRVPAEINCGIVLSSRITDFTIKPLISSMSRPVLIGPIGNTPVQAVRINQREWSIQNVGVTIPALRLLRPAAR